MIRQLASTLLLLAAVPAVGAPLPSVSSTYRDEATGKFVKVQGSGAILEYRNRLFLVTAAHVSQGENPEVLLDGVKLSVLSRLADNVFDVEVMEIRNREDASPVKPFARFKDNYLQEFRVNLEDFGGNAVVRLAPNVFAALPDKLKSLPMAHENDFAKRLHGGLVFSVKTRIVPGMSGAPVTIPLQAPGGAQPLFSGEKDQMRFAGVVTSYLTDFERSYFTTEVKVLDLLKRLTQGQSGRLGLGAWHMRGGLTYRQLGNGLSEIPERTAQAGDAETKDGGDAETKDGGDNEKSTATATAPQSGVEWNKQHVIGFLLQDRANGSRFPVYANVTGALLAATYPDRLQLEKITPMGSDLSIIGEKQAPSGAPAVHLFDFTNSDHYKLRCRGKGSMDQQLLVATDKSISLQVLGCGGDLLRIDLDRKGRVIGEEQKGFQPVLKIKGAGGRIYNVDIKNLFFADANLADGSPVIGRFPVLNDDYINDVKERARRAFVTLQPADGDAMVQIAFRPSENFPYFPGHLRTENGQYFWDNALTAPSKGSCPTCSP